MIEQMIIPTLGYLIGSLNGAIIICYLLKLKDPRSSGSHNPGSTNVFRMHGKKMALLTLLFDFMKGFLPLFLLIKFTFPVSILLFMSISLCLGHIFPIYHQFKGGKGVAVTAGMLTALSPPIAGIAIVAWTTTFVLCNVASIASTVSVGAIWISLIFFHLPQVKLLTILVPTLFIILSHITNYKRLIKGDEKKINIKS